MLVKIEASKPWASYERIFDAHEMLEAEQVAEDLRESGWTVNWINLGEITKEAYSASIVLDCYQKLDLIHSDSDEVAH